MDWTGPELDWDLVWFFFLDKSLATGHCNLQVHLCMVICLTLEIEPMDVPSTSASTDGYDRILEDVGVGLNWDWNWTCSNWTCSNSNFLELELELETVRTLDHLH